MRYIILIVLGFCYASQNVLGETDVFKLQIAKTTIKPALSLGGQSSVADGVDTYGSQVGLYLNLEPPAGSLISSIDLSAVFNLDTSAERLDTDRIRNWAQVDMEVHGRLPWVPGEIQILETTAILTWLFGVDHVTNTIFIERETDWFAGLSMKVESDSAVFGAAFGIVQNNFEFDDDVPRNRGFPPGPKLVHNQTGAFVSLHSLMHFKNGAYLKVGDRAEFNQDRLIRNLLTAVVGKAFGESVDLQLFGEFNLREHNGIRSKFLGFNDDYFFGVRILVKNFL